MDARIGHTLSRRADLFHDLGLGYILYLHTAFMAVTLPDSCCQIVLCLYVCSTANVIHKVTRLHEYSIRPRGLHLCEIAWPLHSICLAILENSYDRK